MIAPYKIPQDTAGIDLATFSLESFVKMLEEADKLGLSIKEVIVIQRNIISTLAKIKEDAHKTENA